MALNAGIERARGEILFFTDVRQPLDPKSLRNLMGCFADPQVGVASGELIILTGETSQEQNVGLYWRYEKWIRKQLSRIDSVLGATGCIYAMRRELACPLPPNTLLDDVYLPLRAFFRGYRIIFDDTAKAFDHPISLDNEFRRKVRTQAGVYQLIVSYPALLGPSNRMWIDFVSHKLGRLLLPFACLLLLITSFWLPSGWGKLVLSTQFLFYGLAALDVWIPEGWWFKRISSPARTFIVLMAAALCAASIAVLPDRYFWKETKVKASAEASP
jgi:cellulose synthase/poly-beta-1,6-N-acetylglucosamine synthase-like glycosyltransferase